MRELRTAKGLSQESLGQLTEMDQGYLSGIETGQRNLSLSNIAAIARAFGLSLAELMEGV